MGKQIYDIRHFNPRAPHGARLHPCGLPCTHTAFQSTRPAWGATDLDVQIAYMLKISIHAPRMGRDTAGAVYRAPAGTNFNPRAPHGARPLKICRELQRFAFQSTRPAWGATARNNIAVLGRCISIHAPRMGRDQASIRIRYVPINFNPRAPHGARRGVPASPAAPRLISIHAPRMGRDQLRTPSALRCGVFQSTRPAWGATCTARPRSLCRRHFNPRAPHGARPGFSGCIRTARKFQSTRPAWGATSATSTCR